MFELKSDTHSYQQTMTSADSLLHGNVSKQIYFNRKKFTGRL